jgi:DNA invertase Pin-like site-specific DNA recombinase
MSTGDQEHSIENQKAVIREYAALNGFQIVHTYEDAGESGLQLKHRNGLRQLLADVLGAGAQYQKIIVLDVSRWGRFQDADEAAHYEFICKRAGVNVVYCAEEFNNEGTVWDYFAKVLKRTAAAEYSRELSMKSFENHKRTVHLGFRVGSQPGYGFRRMAVGRNGEHKGLLKTGQSKALLCDRVTLVHGPEEEVRCVRQIFNMCIKAMSCAEIACALNQQRIRNCDREWKAWMVDDIVKNPKYTGTYRWNQTTQRLHSQSKRNAPENWILRANAFPPIVSQHVFDKAQLRLQVGDHWSERQLVTKLKQLLEKRGYLSERLIQSAKGMPAISTYYKRLGTFKSIYKRVGFDAPPGLFKRSDSRQLTRALREGLFRQIGAIFQGKATVFRVPGKMRQIVKLNGQPLSVLLCPSVHRPNRGTSWSLIPVPSESPFVTLVCRLNSTNDGFHSFHLFRQIDKDKPLKFTEQHQWFLRSERVHSLEEICKVLDRLQGSSPTSMSPGEPTC